MVLKKNENVRDMMKSVREKITDHLEDERLGGIIYRLYNSSNNAKYEPFVRR
jgi:putative aminopeptidase FrvX